VQFLSFEWLGWMAGIVAGYWLLPANWRDRFLIAATLALLLLHSPVSAGILVGFSGLVYFGTRDDGFSGYRILSIGGVIIAVLAYFKIRLSAAPVDIIQDVAIPLGLSYYSFRCLHYVFERYKGTVKPESFQEFIAYLFFLPTIVVGPIHRVGQFFNDYRSRRWSAQLLSEGMERIVYGYFKIAVLGNWLVMNKLGFFIGSLNQEQLALIWYLEVVRAGLNLYFQFSGFSDVAIGFSRLLGYKIIENFNWPYLSQNISEFWRRWHISLTTWTREYIYMPMLGMLRQPTVAALATFVVIGLWHEVSVRYVLWGLYHYLGIMIHQYWQRLERKMGIKKLKNPLIRPIVRAGKILLTVHFVWFSFVIVNQQDLSSALKVYATIFFFWW
jgi:D-alanyl-lipoteichoic acid acyltransferase DltB (MBOAT superfamily)